MDKKEIVERFVQKLEGDANVLCVIVFGSYARGDSDPESDIDLAVILRDGFKRCVEYYEKQAFEITYTTEDKAKKYWNENMQDAVNLWVVGKVLYDRDGTGKRLAAFGCALCQTQPPEVSQETRQHLMFDIDDSLRAIARLMSKDTSRKSTTKSTLINLYHHLPFKYARVFGSVICVYRHYTV